MRDPFQTNSNKQLVREAQFGFTVIGLLVATLIYVAYYRLNDAWDVTPEHIRNAPIAMQVFPNSPNYNRNSNRMQQQRMQQQGTQHQVSAIQVSPSTDLVGPPKRVLQDSARTARSLRDAAETIETSATRIAALTKEPAANKGIDLVSNPAFGSASDQGFKVLSDPLPVKKEMHRTEMLQTEKLSPPVAAAPKLGTANENSNDFKVAFPGNRQPEPKPRPRRAELSDFQPPAPKAQSPEPSNDFKPVDRAEPTAMPEIQSTVLPLGEPAKDDATTAPDVLLPLLQQQSSQKRLPKKEPVLKSEKQSVRVESQQESLVQPVAFTTTQWVVQKGDSFWSIAQARYGDGRFFRALYEQNRCCVPGFEDLAEGVEIEVPSEEELLKRYPELCPTDAVRRNDKWRATPDDLMDKLTLECDSELCERLYETKAKDTLFRIARNQLGQASRYVELLDLNRFRVGENVTHETELPAGIQLLLPEK